jgi:HAE1 family hydrophobic/amphiphilic exporter-1
MVTSLTGFSVLTGAKSSNSGTVFVVLKHWGERPNLEDSSFNAAARIDRQACAQVPEALASVLNNIIVEGNQVPELSSVFSTKRANVPQYFIDVDRVKAKNRGVPLGEMVPLSALVTTKLLSVLSVPCVTTYIGRPLSVPAPVTATAPGRR